MIKINKEMLSNVAEMEWMAEKLDDSFEIKIDDKISKIVFGFNGIGKTTLSRSLLINYSNQLKFLDYENCVDKEAEDKLIISPYISSITEKTKIINLKIKEIDFKTISKKNGFTKTAGANGSELLKTYCKTLKSDSYAAKLSVSDSEFDIFVEKFKNVNLKTYILISNELDLITSSKDEILKYQKSKYTEFLKHSKDYIDFNDGRCPVCNTDKDDLVGIIDKQIELYELNKSELISKLENNNIIFDSKLIDEYIELNRFLKDNDRYLNDFIICGTSVELHKNITAISKDIDYNTAELKELEKQRDEKYKTIEKNAESFKTDISKYLKVDKNCVEFDAENKKIVVKLNRNIQTYSTGERHILWFLNEIYSFIGSDLETLILDDPVSSLDIINLYKIAFEIVRTKTSTKKSIVVFTHSVELINAINSQLPDSMDMYYLEEYKGKIYCDKIDYAGKNIPNVITSQRFDGYEPNIYGSLRKRDYDGYDSDEHCVYHYSEDEKVSSIDSTLTNHSLVEMIDKYSGITKEDFYKNSFQKALLIVALRVWIEKSLYKLIPSTDAQRQNDFLIEKQLNEKISIIENASKYGSNLFSENNINRADIVCKKVMLNQNSHFYSQIMPFAYAINLSLDDLNNEIIEIKNIFSR